MNALEDRLRTALRERADDFSADPDAWARIRARSQAAGARRGPRRWSWPGRFVIPAAAAAAVVAIVVVVTVVVSGVTGRSVGAPPAGAGSPAPVSSSAGPGSAGAPVGPYAPSGPAEQLLATDPPDSAILALRVTAPTTGPTSPTAPRVVTAYAWLAHTSSSAWLDQLQGRQFCYDAVYPDGASSGACQPLPQLGAGQLAATVASANLGAGVGPVVLQGVAASQVTSVTAVLPGGRIIAGVVKTGRGFPDEAWAVAYPQASGVRLVFRDSSGSAVASLGTAAPAGPPQVAEPSSGGVVAFTYPKLAGVPGDTMYAYLIDGYVGFFTGPGDNGSISPVLAEGTPALGGMIQSFPEPGNTPTRSQIRYDLRHHKKIPQPPVLWKAFGYAHADVARVVLHLPHGQQVSTSTFAAGWTGSDLRLWVADLPGSFSFGRPPTATAYDSSGAVIGQVTLGTSY